MTSWLKLWVLVGLLAAAMPAPARAQIVAAGADEITGEGVVDGWTNVLYVNESNPFSFVGTDHGLTTTFDFWVNASRVSQGVVTPFIAEPLSDSPEFGDEFIVRAIGTTREAGAHWQCGGLYQYPFHDSEVFEIQDGWVAGFMSSDPLSERPDALSPIPFIANYGTDGWLTGTGTAGSGVPIVELNEGIVEGASGTDVDAFGFREYQFQILAASGDVQPPIGPGGKVGEGCPVPVGGNVAGAEIVVNDGGPDGWTNVLYINEERPFDFSDFGTDRGTLDEVSSAST